MKQAQTPQLFGALLIAAVTCCFLLVIAYKWVMLELPSTGMVPLFIAGLFVVGGFFAFVVCVMANLLLRIGPPKLRLPLSAMTWLVFVGICVGLLLDSGADTSRTLIAATITVLSGLLIGPYWAETLIGGWFLKRLAESQSSTS